MESQGNAREGRHPRVLSYSNKMKGSPLMYLRDLSELMLLRYQDNKG